MTTVIACTPLASLIALLIACMHAARLSEEQVSAAEAWCDEIGVGSLAELPAHVAVDSEEGRALVNALGLKPIPGKKLLRTLADLKPPATALSAAADESPTPPPPPSCNEFQTEAFEAASSDVGLSGASLATSSGSGAAVGALAEGECAWRFVILSSAQNDGMAMVLGVAGEAGLHGPAWGLLPAKGRVIATQTATEFGAWGAQLRGVSLQPGQANGALVDVRVSTDRRLLFRLSVPSSSYVGPWQDAQLSTALPPRVRPWALLMRSGDSVSLSRHPHPAA